MHKDNTPIYNVNRQVVNFKDFHPEEEKPELDRIKKSYKKNELEKGQKEKKYKFNNVTRKLDDLDKSEVEDKLDSLKESIDHNSNWKEFKEFLLYMDFDLYDGENQLHDKFIEICNTKLSPSEKSEKICSYIEDGWGLYDGYKETKTFLKNLISKSESVKENNQHDDFRKEAEDILHSCEKCFMEDGPNSMDTVISLSDAIDAITKYLIDQDYFNNR